MKTTRLPEKLIGWAIYMIALSLITSCNWGPFKKDNERKKTFAEKVEELEAKKQLYCDLSRPQYEAQGWMVGRCDGLLWTSLWGVACGDVSIAGFESKSEPGRWYRQPEQNCFIPPATDNGSKSSISRDMYLGLMWFMWVNRLKPELDRTIKYGEEKNWVVGEAINEIELVTRATITPGLSSLLYDMQSKLENSLASNVDPNSSDDAVGINTGFRAHLDVLRISLSGDVHGAINDLDLRTLRELASREKNNALYQAWYSIYSSGDLNKSVDLLLDTKYFPSDRLPTKEDNYCTDYLFQRDEFKDGKVNKDWLPCPEESAPHSGTDLVFASYVILESLKE